eukprot:1156363-Pelagomonas_calceolata.AAC.8
MTNPKKAAQAEASTHIIQPCPLPSPTLLPKTPRSSPQEQLPCAAAFAALFLCIQGCLQAVYARVDANDISIHVEARQAHSNQAADLHVESTQGVKQVFVQV